MPRIPYPDPAAVSEARRAFLTDPDRRILNITRMLTHAPDPFWSGQRALGFATIGETRISAEMRELLILRVAYLSKSEYELFHHLNLARSIGVPEEKCEAMRTGDYAALAEDEAAMARFVTEVVEDVSPTDDALAAMRAIFDDETLMEIVLFVGNYMALARVAAVTGIENDATAITAWPVKR